MTKDLSSYFKPAADSTALPGQTRGETKLTTTFDELPVTGDGAKVIDQSGDSLDSLFDNIDFDAVAARNEERAESGEEFVDDGDCEGCKI